MAQSSGRLVTEHLVCCACRGRSNESQQQAAPQQRAAHHRHQPTRVGEDGAVLHGGGVGGEALPHPACHHRVVHQALERVGQAGAHGHATLVQELEPVRHQQLPIRKSASGHSKQQSRRQRHRYGLFAAAQASGIQAKHSSSTTRPELAGERPRIGDEGGRQQHVACEDSGRAGAMPARCRHTCHGAACRQSTPLPALSYLSAHDNRRAAAPPWTPTARPLPQNVQRRGEKVNHFDAL